MIILPVHLALTAPPSVLAANDRIVAWNGYGGAYALDRTQRQVIALVPYAATRLRPPEVFIRGTTLAYYSGTFTAQDVGTYSFIDTTHLP